MFFYYINREVRRRKIGTDSRRVKGLVGFVEGDHLGDVQRVGVAPKWALRNEVGLLEEFHKRNLYKAISVKELQSSDWHVFLVV